VEGGETEDEAIGLLLGVEMVQEYEISVLCGC
jgi:hypothetical protein